MSNVSLGSAEPIVVTQRAMVPAVTLAADLDTPVMTAPFAGTIVGVTYTANAVFTGAVTNNRTFSVINKGQAGAGALVAATLNMANGVNLAAFVPKAIPVSGVPANVAVAQGDVIDFQSLHVGTGIADPGGLVEISFSRIAGA